MDSLMLKLEYLQAKVSEKVEDTDKSIRRGTTVVGDCDDHLSKASGRALALTLVNTVKPWSTELPEVGYRIISSFLVPIVYIDCS